ncbi:Set domain protein [Operophtera brumata]|uniref:Set domain protein n=1 Tax=Operophtera brumata TaxID=104452 RepID=A0A0L7LFY4_OPEBR|nr:Set domain protein [Operophtera brumata]
MTRKHEIRDENFYFLTLDKERMIDAGPKGNLARTKNGALTAKRKHTKRKNVEETPSNKNKVKKPLGRPPKPKELTEIEKDLLIINSATVSNSESSRPQSVEEKQLRPLKSKIVSNSTDEVIISNGNKPNTILEKELDNSVKEVTVSKDTEPSKEKLDCKPLEEVSISNDTESNKALQKKLDFNTIEELSLSSTETSKGPNKPVNRKLDSKLTREATLSNGTLPRKALKRKLHSMSIEEVSLSSTEPSGKRQKCDKQIEVGD